MKILSLECSAGPCSAAITENGRVIAEAFINVKLTHSQTLMPMVEGVLNYSKIRMDELDGIAVSAGPGSFTGVRIGIGAVKGLAAARPIMCVGVSTLEAMAYNFIDTDCTVCAVMDARCNQVYNALFEVSGGKITRLCPDRALMCDELAAELEALPRSDKKPVITVGDGAELFYSYAAKLDNTVLACDRRRYQNAVGVGLAAECEFRNGKAVAPSELLPIYLRLPQAERELKLKKEQKK